VTTQMTDTPPTRRPQPFSDPEKASAAGKRSAELRRARAAASPEARAREAMRSSAEKLTQSLLDAALGRDVFVNLSPADRLKATIKALEYAVGRPGAKEDDDDDTPELPTGESLFGTPAVGG
jgi:hypothetical protein